MAKTTSTLAMHTRLPEGYRPGWCVEHQHLGAMYDDGSGHCMHALIVESGSGECRFVAGRIALPRGAVKRRKDGSA